MNNDPNPLIPQGSLQQASAKSKSTMRLAIFIVAIVHVALIGGILMVGCKREEAKPDPAKQAQVQNNLPPLDPTYYPPVSNDPSTGAVPPDPLGGSLPPLPPPAGTTVTSTPPAVGGAIPGGTAMDPLLPPAPSIPDASLPPAPAPVEEGVVYAIAKGDTFSSIASRKGVSVAAILKANPGIDPTRLQIGQKIKLPAGANGAAASSSVSTSAPATASASSSYTVKSGDTLTRIARKHNTTVAALKSANGLRTDRINVGQKLKVPGSAKPAPAVEPAVVAPPVDPLGGALPPLPPPGNP